MAPSMHTDAGRPPRFSAWIALGLLALALAGCGGGNDGGGNKGPAKAGDPRAAKAESGVRATAVAYVEALVSKDYAAACAQLTPAAQSKAGGAGPASGCNARLAGALAQVPEARLKSVEGGARTVKITVTGDTARSDPVPGGERTGGHYRYLGGRWYIADKSGQ